MLVCYGINILTNMSQLDHNHSTTSYEEENLILEQLLSATNGEKDEIIKPPFSICKVCVCILCTFLSYGHIFGINRNDKAFEETLHKMHKKI